MGGRGGWGGDRKADSAVVSPNPPGQCRKGLQTLTESGGKGNRPTNCAQVGRNLIFEAIYFIKANYLCSLTLGNVNEQTKNVNYVPSNDFYIKDANSA